MVGAVLSLAAVGAGELSFAGGGVCCAAVTITVRVAEPVRPLGSVTVYRIVCVPGVLVSICTLPSVEVALSTTTVRPRFSRLAGR